LLQKLELDDEQRRLLAEYLDENDLKKPASGRTGGSK